MKTFNNFKKILISTISVLGGVVLLCYTDTYKASVSDGLNACFNVLLPSLFPFFFLSSFVIYSGGIFYVTKFLGIIGKILNVSKNALPAVLLSMIGGFPVGCKTVVTLIEEGKITEKEGEILCYCCVGAGPGFLITFVGEGMFRCRELGFYLLLSNVISVLLLIIINFRIIFRKKIYTYPSSQKVQNHSIGDSIIRATDSSIKSSLTMCGFVVIFSVINRLLSLAPFYNEYLGYFLEITSGIINSYRETEFEVIAFFIGFGGLCVHFQIFGIIKNIHINKGYFFITRIVQGIISAFTIHILLKIKPITVSTFSNIISTPNGKIATTLWGSVALIILSVIFLISINHKNKQEVNLCAE